MPVVVKHSRSSFQDKLNLRFELASTLEIGPLNRPIMSGERVKYFDLFETKKLKEKATIEGLDPETVPNIDYHDSNGDLSGITEKFDLIISSHVLEHQPDLICHLLAVQRLLVAGGHYAFVIPDHRYCFDAKLPPSRITEIIRANHEKKIKPDLYSVIEHRALTTHNESALHWKGQNIPDLNDFKNRYLRAVSEFETSNGNYIDVHCWQFTPRTFSTIIQGLRELEMINFEVVELYETSENDLEFFGLLRKTKN